MAKVEPKIVRGLAQIGISKITIGVDDTYTYAPIERFYGSREFSAEPQGELYELYADSGIYYAEETNNGYIGKLTMVRLADKFKKEIMGLKEDSKDKMLYEKADSVADYAEETNNGYIGKLTMVRLADKFKKEIMGLKEDSKDKMLYEKADSVAVPKFGLVVNCLTDISKGLYYIFYDCQISKRPTIAFQTQEKTISPQLEEIEILISPRSYDKMVVSMNTAETPDEVFNKLSTEIWEPSKGGLAL